jgi:gamma-glutamyl phosphate reductase
MATKLSPDPKTAMMMQEAVKSAKEASLRGATRRRQYQILKNIRDLLNEEMAQIVDSMGEDLE